MKAHYLQPFVVKLQMMPFFKNLTELLLPIKKIRLSGSEVEWLKCQAHDQHGLSSKPTCSILLCPWERHFMVYSSACWSWQAVLNYSHISIKIKLQADSNILVSPEAGRGNCLPFPASQEDKYRNKIKLLVDEFKSNKTFMVKN